LYIYILHVWRLYSADSVTVNARDDRQLDGRPHVMSALGADIISDFIARCTVSLLPTP